MLDTQRITVGYMPWNEQRIEDTELHLNSPLYGIRRMHGMGVCELVTLALGYGYPAINAGLRDITLDGFRRYAPTDGVLRIHLLGIT